MRYCKISIALLCLFASNSFALDIITSSENSALLDIHEKHDIDSQLISANDKLSRYNKSEYDYKSLATKIFNDKVSYEKLVTALPEKVLSREGVNAYFKKIEGLVLSIDQSEKKYITSGIALKEEQQMIATDYDKLNDLRTQKSKQLSALKKQVVDRLVSDLSKPSSIQRIDLEGETSCSKFQSISDCLNENETIIVSQTKKSEPFLNERSVLLSYNVHNASMDMNGTLNYNISMSFKPSYNNKVEALLNERFGLKSAIITLESNVEADWYIDGNKIGQGKKIQHEVTLGQHGILASYQSHDQSTLEVIEGNAQFNYVFQNNTVPLSPKKASKANSTGKKEKAKAPKKTTQQVKPQKNKKAEITPVEEEKDYLYFMGIEAESDVQEKSFSE